jgi:hypothetical protein
VVTVDIYGSTLSGSMELVEVGPDVLELLEELVEIGTVEELDGLAELVIVFPDWVEDPLDADDVDEILPVSELLDCI